MNKETIYREQLLWAIEIIELFNPQVERDLINRKIVKSKFPHVSTIYVNPLVKERRKEALEMSKASFSNETKDSKGSQKNMTSTNFNAFNLGGSKQSVMNKPFHCISPNLSFFDSNSSMRSIPEYNKFNSGTIPYITPNTYLNPYPMSAFNSINSFNSNQINTPPSNYFYPSMVNLIPSQKPEPIMINQPSDKFKALLEEYDKKPSNNNTTNLIESQDHLMETPNSRLGLPPKAYKPETTTPFRYNFNDIKKFNSTRPEDTSSNINKNLFPCKTEKDFSSTKSSKLNRSLLGIRLEEGNDEDIIPVPEVVDQILARKFNKEIRNTQTSFTQPADDWQEYLSKNHPEEFANLLEKKS